LDKAPDAFRTISEVADEIDVPQHVLRFWESRFTQIKPMKRGGGRRYYRPDDVDLLRGVRHLLYGEGYTIRGVQRILRDEGAAFVQNVWRPGAELPPPPDTEDEPEGFVEEVAETRAERSLLSRAGEAAPAERREPTIVPGTSLNPSAQTSRAAEDTLRRVLDELIACRRLIDTALSGNDAAG
jgi:DNA-binding transcriptional MerR regulator